MKHILSIKIDDRLLGQIEKRCARELQSKGAIIRKALIHFFETHEDSGENQKNFYSENDFKKITQDLLANKKKSQMTLEDFQKKAIKTSSKLNPEEEVLYYRRRRL